jgi:CRISPR/Cas system-associated protein Csx1
MKPLKKYEEKYPKYYQDSISSIEAKLLVCINVKDAETLNQFCHTSMKAFKRLCSKEDITIYKNKKNAMMTSTRTNQLVHHRLSKNITEAVMAISTCEESQFH